MRRSAALLLLWLGLLGLAGCQTGRSEAPADTSAGATAASFPTRSVSGFRELLTGASEPNSRSIGALIPPDGLAPGERAPAMVILHGSGGEWSGRGARQAAFLAEHGVAALVVDTFTARGQTRETRYIERLRHANMPDQIADAYAALDLLARHPAVDPARIGVMGYSMGGASALLSAYAQVADSVAIGEARFALHVAYYAPCFLTAAEKTTTGAPVLAIWGEKDESADRDACETEMRGLAAGGSEVSQAWLPDAVHGWNGRRDPRFVPTAPRCSPCLYEIQADGGVIERRTGLSADTDAALIHVLEQCSAQGYTIGRNAEAEAEANRLLLEAIGRL